MNAHDVWVDESSADDYPELVVRFDPDWQTLNLKIEGGNTWLRLVVSPELAAGDLASLPRTESS